MPAATIKGKIKPVVKNNFSGKCILTIYRPFMILPNFLKGFEYCLLPILPKQLPFQCNQFGFRKGSRCPSTVTVVRENVFRYVREESKVHFVMFDVKKVF